MKQRYNMRTDKHMIKNYYYYYYIFPLHQGYNFTSFFLFEWWLWMNESSWSWDKKNLICNNKGFFMGPPKRISEGISEGRSVGSKMKEFLIWYHWAWCKRIRNGTISCYFCCALPFVLCLKKNNNIIISCNIISIPLPALNM